MIFNRGYQFIIGAQVLEKFDLVFRGELVKSFEPDVAKRNVGKLFKIDGAKLDKMFSGKAIVLKRNLDLDTANKYRVAIKKAGARVDLVANTHEVPAPTNAAAAGARSTHSTKATPAPQAEPPAAESAAKVKVKPMESGLSLAPMPSQFGVQETPKETRPEAVSVENSVARQVSKTVDQSVDVLPIGTQLSETIERVDLPLIDVSALSVQELEGNLVKDSEREVVVPPLIDVGELDIEPQGGDLLHASEKKAFEEKVIDLSGYEVDELGVQLSQGKQDNAQAPDVSHLSVSRD